MPLHVVTGASLQCVPFGTAPSSFIAIPKGPPVLINGMPAASIMDFAPMANILPFAMCTSLANPAVASATTAAMGVLTPMPCVPSIVAPWYPGSTKVLVNKMPALPDTAVCNCAWGGVVRVIYAGQVKTAIV